MKTLFLLLAFACCANAQAPPSSMVDIGNNSCLSPEPCSPSVPCELRFPFTGMHVWLGGEPGFGIPAPYDYKLILGVRASLDCIGGPGPAAIYFAGPNGELQLPIQLNLPGVLYATQWIDPIGSVPIHNQFPGVSGEYTYGPLEITMPAPFNQPGSVHYVQGIVAVGMTALTTSYMAIVY